MAEAPPSSAPVTLRLIEQYLTAMGHGDHFLRDSVIEERLDSEKISTKTLFDALQIAHDPNHPLFCNLQLNVSEQMTLINKLVGILTNASGFRRVMQTAARNSNDNPYQFILGLLQFIRG